MKPYKAAQSFVWVQSESGNTYICPTGALKDPKNATEEELQRSCIDESSNPQNN